MVYPEGLLVDELQHKELSDEEEVSLYFTMEEFFSLFYSVLVLVNIGLAICARIYVNIGIFIPI